MSATVVALALFAAVLHATWNAFLRSGADRLWTVTVMSAAMTVVAIPLAFVFPLPPSDAWPYFVLSSCLQVGYSFLLVAAYRHSALGQVYPIVRGSVPLLVTLGGLALAGQHVTGRAGLGVLLVALGIISLSWRTARSGTRSILFAVATGFVIASYATVDAVGVRAAGNAGTYATWVCLIYGSLLPASYVAVRGRLALDVRTPEARKAVAGGALSLLAYGAVVAAFALGPVGPVTALRETSVVFAAVIGRIFLREVLTARRVASCVVVTLGAVCLGYQS